MSSIFTKIINKEIPSYTIYEDEYIYAFLDIFPQRLGHTLIVPKIEIDHFSDVPEPYYSALFLAAKKISSAIQSATGCNRVCASFVGYEIPHCHYHIVPTDTINDTYIIQRPQADPKELKEIQEKIVTALFVGENSK